MDFLQRLYKYIHKPYRTVPQTNTQYFIYLEYGMINKAMRQRRQASLDINSSLAIFKLFSQFQLTINVS